MSPKTTVSLPTPLQVRLAFKQWHNDSNTPSPLAMLYLFRKAHRETGRNPRHTTNQILLHAMEVLQQTYARDVQFLRLRFLDQWSINHLANHFNVAESTIYILQRQATHRLSETLQDLEQQAVREKKQRLLYRLEAPTYGELVGIDAASTALLKKLRVPDSPWVLAIEGLGGIGKTALANAVMHTLIEQGAYDEMGWVSARQNRLNLGESITSVAQPALTTAALTEALVQQLMPELVDATRQSGDDLLPKLRTRLKQTPHLIVIDNLETVADIESLLPALQALANPSKFLLTSRYGLYSTPNIYHFKVPELSETHALQLIRQEAEISNLPALAAAPEHDLRPIYATVGGNPLALRLVVGQTHIYTLESILGHLHAARGQGAENLYTYIYRHAWASLDATSQDVLLIMPLVNPNGDEIEVISEVGEMEVGLVRNALNQLVTLNLVDTRGNFQDRRYSIHGLTRTFLHEQVLRWPRSAK